MRSLTHMHMQYIRGNIRIIIQIIRCVNVILKYSLYSCFYSLVSSHHGMDGAANTVGTHFTYFSHNLYLCIPCSWFIRYVFL